MVKTGVSKRASAYYLSLRFPAHNGELQQKTEIYNNKSAQMGGLVFYIMLTTAAK